MKGNPRGALAAPRMRVANLGLLASANALQYTPSSPADRARLSFDHTGTATHAASIFPDARRVRRRFIPWVFRLLIFLHGQVLWLGDRG